MIKLVPEFTAKHMIMAQEKLSDVIILLNHYAEPLSKRKKKLKEEESKALSDIVELR